MYFYNLESSKARKSDESKSRSRSKEAEEEPKIPIKKKSSLKLKEKTSQTELRLKESLSLKKVEFNPTTEIFTPQSQPEQPDVDNNNWIQGVGRAEVRDAAEDPLPSVEMESTTSASESTPMSLPPAKANSVEPIAQTPDPLKVSSKY